MIKANSKASNTIEVTEPTVRVIFDLSANKIERIWILGADEAQREKALLRLAKVVLQIDLLEAALRTP